MNELKPKVALMDISEEDTKPIQDELESIRKEAQAVSGRVSIIIFGLSLLSFRNLWHN